MVNREFYISLRVCVMFIKIMSVERAVEMLVAIESEGKLQFLKIPSKLFLNSNFAESSSPIT